MPRRGDSVCMTSCVVSATAPPARAPPQRARHSPRSFRLAWTTELLRQAGPASCRCHVFAPATGPGRWVLPRPPSPLAGGHGFILLLQISKRGPRKVAPTRHDDTYRSRGHSGLDSPRRAPPWLFSDFVATLGHWLQVVRWRQDHQHSQVCLVSGNGARLLRGGTLRQARAGPHFLRVQAHALRGLWRPGSASRWPARPLPAQSRARAG